MQTSCMSRAGCAQDTVSGFGWESENTGKATTYHDMLPPGPGTSGREPLLES